MIRYIEYLYLAAAIGGSGYLAANFKDLPVTNKAFLGFMIILCAFMFSFRRKQRQMFERMDAENEANAQEEADDDANREENEPEA